MLEDDPKTSDQNENPTATDANKKTVGPDTHPRNPNLKPLWKKGEVVPRPPAATGIMRNMGFRKLAQSFLQMTERQKNELTRAVRKKLRLNRNPTQQEILLEISFRKALTEKEPYWTQFLLEQAYGKVPNRLNLGDFGEEGEGGNKITAIAIQFSDQLKPRFGSKALEENQDNNGNNGHGVIEIEINNDNDNNGGKPE